jgi:hypothetical protein
MERWSCIDCGTRVPVSKERCPSCGYERNEYDLAAAAEDTGQYLISRISVPELNTTEYGPSVLKILMAIIIGIGIGTAAILLLKFIL